MSRAPELPGGNRGHKNIEDKGSGLNDFLCQPKKSHHGDVTRRARMTYGRVQERHRQNSGGQKSNLGIQAATPGQISAHQASILALMASRIFRVPANFSS